MSSCQCSRNSACKTSRCDCVSDGKFCNDNCSCDPDLCVNIEETSDEESVVTQKFSKTSKSDEATNSSTLANSKELKNKSSTRQDLLETASEITQMLNKMFPEVVILL